MGLTTSYSKAETDVKIQNIKKLFGTGIHDKPLKISDPVPILNGGYFLSDVGDYSFGTAEPGKLNVAFLSADGWEIVDVDIDVKSLEDWTAKNYIQKSLVIYNDSIYRVADGQTASSTDVPGVSDKWKQFGSKVSPIFDPTSKTEAQGGEQIYDFILKNEKKALPNLQIISSDFSNEGYLNSLGLFIPLVGWKCTEFIKVYKGEILEIKLYGASSPSTSYTAVSLFDLNKSNPLSFLQFPIFDGSGVNHEEVLFVDSVVIPKDGYIRIANRTYNNKFDFSANTFPVGFEKKIYVTPDDLKTFTIYQNRTLYALNYGLKEDNTELDNKAILDNLINKAFNEGRSIELPEGKYPISNIVMKPCNIYGKDRNTLLESKTPEPMFIMDPMFGKENIDNHTTNGIKGGYYTGFEIAGFGLKGNNIATKGFWFGTHAFANYERLFFHGFSDVAIHTTGMLICKFNDIQIRKVKNGIRADHFSGYRANLVYFNVLNIENCQGIGVDWKNGSAVHFNGLDTEMIGTIGDLDTGAILFSDIPSEYDGGIGITIENSWAEYVNGGFYAKLNGNAVHSIKNTNVIKLSGDAPNSVINNGGKLLVENTRLSGSSLLTLNGGQTLVQGFNDITNHDELNGGQYRNNSPLFNLVER